MRSLRLGVLGFCDFFGVISKVVLGGFSNVLLTCCRKVYKLGVFTFHMLSNFTLSFYRFVRSLFFIFYGLALLQSPFVLSADILPGQCSEPLPALLADISQPELLLLVEEPKSLAFSSTQTWDPFLQQMIQGQPLFTGDWRNHIKLPVPPSNQCCLYFLRYIKFY